MSPDQWSQIKQIIAAASDLPAGERIPYLKQACTDSDLRREAESLLLRLERPGLLDSRDLPLPPSSFPHLQPMTGGHAGPYQLVREIGHGGMGSVYLAVRADDQYVKLAAVKLLRTGLDSNFFMERFRNERQILAGLEHPNIARLLDGGASDTGIPYLVMEYVEGEPLGTYCDSHRLSILKRLELFHGVCLAVQYAHQHLVVHRDIKPGNILVTPDGIPKLLDFGIAKIISSDAATGCPAATVSMLRMMTPEYASPEQFRGTAITTSTDVYSLGVVLYELLTGQHPYRLLSRDPLEVARAMSEQEPERPSAAVIRDNDARYEGKAAGRTPVQLSKDRNMEPRNLVRTLRGDLDAIVMKALRKEPQDRYATVGELSSDLRRYLEGKPVLARRGTRTYHARKFIRRHRWGVGIAAAGLLLGITGVAAIVREAHIARIQRARAERRFNDVRKLSHSLLFELHDAIEHLPGSTPARKLLVQDALTYLDSLARESGGDQNLQRELASAYERVGNVQGNQYVSNLGDTADALRSYEKALSIRQTLATTNPDNIQDTLDLAHVLELVAVSLVNNGDAPSAKASIQKAVGLAEGLLQKHPGDLRVVDELLYAYDVEAGIARTYVNSANLGDTSLARDALQKMLILNKRLLQANPRDFKTRRRMATNILQMGDGFLLSGDRHQALEYYLEAQARFKALARESDPAFTIRDLGSADNRIGTVHVFDGESAKALPSFQEDLDISKSLATADPNNAQALLDLAEGYANLGDAECRMGNCSDGVAKLQNALTLTGRLILVNPNNTEFRGVQANISVMAGEASGRRGDLSGALALLGKGSAIYEKLATDNPTALDSRLCLAASYDEAASAWVRIGESQKAAVLYHKALKLSLPETKPPHPNEQALYNAADSYSGLGDVAMTAGMAPGSPRHQRVQQLLEARSWYAQSLQTWNQVRQPAAESPDGFDAVEPKLVRQNLYKCNAALSRLDHSISNEKTGTE